MMAACDTFRSGAVEQLRTHARRLEVQLWMVEYLISLGFSIEHLYCR